MSSAVGAPSPARPGGWQKRCSGRNAMALSQTLFSCIRRKPRWRGIVRMARCYALS